MTVVRVGILGHSYTPDLASLGVTEGQIDSETVLELRYFAKPGSCFDYWIDFPNELHDCIHYSPHIVFISLGGNSIKENIRVKSLKEKADILFSIIRNNLPDCKIIPIQVECRYLIETNRFGNPPYPRYKQIRNKLNKALQQSKKRDFICCIAGPNRLDSRKYFQSDGVHLTKIGLKKYFNYILRTIDYVHRVADLK